MIIDRGHEAMIEHSSLSVKFVVDRGVSHELVRHRILAELKERLSIIFDDIVAEE